MHPEVFSWGVLHVRTYGLMLAVAFLIGTWIALVEARRRRIDEDRLVSVILVALVAGVLGARALYVMEHLGEFRNAWGSVLALWQGGLTLYGGIVTGTGAALIAARRLGLPMWTTADLLTPSLALGTAFGRVGCYLNGCCYGRPTGLPWGVVYPADAFATLEFGATPVHPSQIYFAGLGLVMFAVLWPLRHRFSPPGSLFWAFVGLFALVRVPLDWTRAYEPTAVVLGNGPWALVESQVTSLALALFSALMILRLRRESRVTVVPASAPAP